MKEDEVEVLKRFKSDLQYIQNEVIAQQPDGAYTKWSRILNAVTVVGITYSQFIDYWVKLYKNYPDYVDDIVKACENKLDNDLISREQMIDMIKKSKDYECEKIRAIEALGGEYNG